jgi:hypothetical protein
MQSSSEVKLFIFRRNEKCMSAETKIQRQNQGEALRKPAVNLDEPWHKSGASFQKTRGAKTQESHFVRRVKPIWAICKERLADWG